MRVDALQEVVRDLRSTGDILSVHGYVQQFDVLKGFAAIIFNIFTGSGTEISFCSIVCYMNACRTMSLTNACK